jgi:hypothetical protein
MFYGKIETLEVSTPTRTEANVFKPFELQGRPIEDQFMNWNTMIKPPTTRTKSTPTPEPE